MRGIEVFQKVVKDSQYLYFRSESEQKPWEYEITDDEDSAKKGKNWVLLDLWTASRVMSVYDNLSDKNKAAMYDLGIFTCIEITENIFRRAGK